MRQFPIDRGGKVAYTGDKGLFGRDDQAFEHAVAAVLA